jgi:8-oxo-dGTP diphosphatase
MAAPPSDRNIAHDMTHGPLSAVSAAIFHDGRFLLVRRGRAPAKGLYAFPGGRVEQDESLADAVRREVMEETGATLASVDHLVDLEIVSEDDTDRVEFVLSVHVAGFAGGDIAPGDDADAVAWLTLDEMARLPLAGSVLEIARQIAEEQASCGG